MRLSHSGWRYRFSSSGSSYHILPAMADAGRPRRGRLRQQPTAAPSRHRPRRPAAERSTGAAVRTATPAHTPGFRRRFRCRRRGLAGHRGAYSRVVLVTAAQAPGFGGDRGVGATVGWGLRPGRRGSAGECGMGAAVRRGSRPGRRRSAGDWGVGARRAPASFAVSSFVPCARPEFRTPSPRVHRP
jgi:hypothetical protein